jgi:hypothetical protein
MGVFVHMDAVLARHIDALRELCGDGVFQMPADVSVMHDAKLSQQFEMYRQAPQLAALDRMKLYKLAWDLSAPSSPAGEGPDGELRRPGQGYGHQAQGGVKGVKSRCRATCLPA